MLSYKNLPPIRDQGRPDTVNIFDFPQDFSTPCLIIDLNGALLHTNTAAASWLAGNPRLLATDGILRPRRQDEALRFTELLAQFAGRDQTAPTQPAAMTLGDRTGHPSLVLTLRCLPNRDTQTLILVQLADLTSTGPIDKPFLRAVFGLTVAEAKVAEAVLRHSGTEMAAEALGISVETMRRHLKNIMAKLGVRSQARLHATLIRALTLAPPAA